MIEELKNLQLEDTILFADDQVIDFFEKDEMMVTGVRIYTSDDSEMIIVEMDEFYLIAHNFQSDEICYVYRLIDEGDISSLEDNGYKFLSEDDDFRYKIVIRDEGKTHIYHHSDTGAIYSLNRERIDDESGEPQEVSLCEFKSSSNKLNYILIEREDNHTCIMQGFEVKEKHIELPESE